MMEPLQTSLVIRLHLRQHEGKERMFADFPYNKTLIGIIKEILALGDTGTCVVAFISCLRGDTATLSSSGVAVKSS